MKTIKKNLLLPVLLLMLSPNIFGQEISSQLCNTIFDSITKSLEPSKTFRRNIYNTDCDFEFIIPGNIKVLLTIERYQTKRQSHKSFNDDLAQFIILKDKSFLNKTSYRGYWDEVAIYQSNESDGNDNFVLLRKKTYVIEMFSDKLEILNNLEQMLRDIEFKE